MISNIKRFDEITISNLIHSNALQNPYLSIDASTYGYTTDNISTDILHYGDEINLILYKYYNTLQLMQIQTSDDAIIDEVSKYILKNQLKIISGDVSLVKRICNNIDVHSTIKQGVIIDMSGLKRVELKTSIVAGEKYLEEIAELICSEPSMGSQYTVSMLYKQLFERQIEYGCKNRVIIVDNKIASHIATYAENDTVAVISGLVTIPQYRGRGYGKCLLSDLVDDILQERKTPLLYCYEKKVIDWYLSLGGRIVCYCAKAEF